MTKKALAEKLAAQESVTTVLAKRLVELDRLLTLAPCKPVPAPTAPYRHTAEEGLAIGNRLVSGQTVPCRKSDPDRRVVASMTRHARNMAQRDTKGEWRYQKDSTRLVFTWIHGRRQEDNRSTLEVICERGFCRATVLRWHNPNPRA